ncbi:uncharacterized protein LOC123514931 [Portunus trituberculatus]|uniref:uncharacterized protein LOC123514931 n=1 Tax=Portunus trituberculatus TaxID=210409 RepID=UPI001E1D015E|nr:uncharacterized protein LOC123514931 [Portunus trituberculatus]
MYKVQVERVSHMQELHLPARSPQVTTRMVTQTPGELLLTRCRTWHHQRQYINSCARKWNTLLASQEINLSDTNTQTFKVQREELHGMSLFHPHSLGTLRLFLLAAVICLQDGAAGGTTHLEGVVKRVAKHHLAQCYLVVVTTEEGAAALTPVARSLWEVFYPFLWVAVGAAATPASVVDGLRERDPRFSCRAFLLDLSRPADSIHQLKFLEDTHLHLWPETRVVGVGPPLSAPADTRTLLTHPAFRNTPHVLYFALHAHDDPPDAQKSGLIPWGTEESCGAVVEEGWQERGVPAGACGEGGSVEVFRRCLYCLAGEAAVLLVTRWRGGGGGGGGGGDSSVDLFPDEFGNLAGHQFRIVSMDWYPFLSFRRDSNASDTTVTPLDSLDFRMLTAVSSVLNFTYEMRVPWDNQWGVSQEDGNWTGTVGTLQHHGADFSMLLSWLPSRMAVVDYSRVYISEPLVIVTSKPGPLPQIFALVRPFPDVLWAAVVLASLAAGVLMWALEEAWLWACGGEGARDLRRRGLSGSLLTAWRMLLEDPEPCMPSYMTASHTS